ncbi:peptidase [Natronobacterium texcoconense]|uniref:STE24 endopeptidase n=1 Tax=Natronobacterium texcoconense TaxID=1095778 RepID=A0A1H1GCF0_NATTX|nr:peptidase [Natronobacterium texcoconense]SDR10785.1 STE24 endopeptidase [Natronobacterium texcoconense]
MSLLVTAVSWTLLAVFVAIGAVCSLAVGYLYGRLARNWSGEAAARWTNVLTGATGFLAGVVTWVVGNAGLFAPGDGFVDTLVTILASAGAAIVVSGATITAILRADPDLPGVDHVPTVRRHYLRYLTVLFVFVFLLASGIVTALDGGPVGLVLLLFGLWIAAWAGSPLFSGLSSRTRRPTDDERARIDPLLERVDLSIRDVRIVEADDQYLRVEVAGAPGGRFLFVPEAALETFDDETLTALLASRREQATHFEQLLSVAPYVGSLIVVLLVLGSDSVSLVPGLVAALVVAAVGLLGTRKLRYYTDARAGAAVGAETLADAFERAAKAAGVDLEDAPGWNLFSKTPPLAERIERLREREEVENGR